MRDTSDKTHSEETRRETTKVRQQTETSVKGATDISVGATEEA